MASPSKKLIQDPNATLILDRPHRFAIGDRVRHVDDEGDGYCVVKALTLMNSVANVFVPTYVLEVHDEVDDESILEDVLCTADLVAVRRA